MSMRRYFGRANGTRRRPKNFPLGWVLATGATICGFVLVGVLITNPGHDRPANEEGSRPTTVGVTPTTTPTPTPTPTKHRGTAF
jgi:hypothetical protein